MRGMSLIGSLGIVTVVVALLAWALVSRILSGSANTSPPPAPAVGQTSSSVARGTSTTASPAAATSASPGEQVTTAPGESVTVSEVVLRCTATTPTQVQARLTFTSTGKVPVTLVAGNQIPTQVPTGRVTLTLTGTASPSSCSALVAGHAYGPIPAAAP